MSNWFHTIAGRYNPREKWVGLDYAKLLGDTKVADSVMAHELAHALISETTDFGQATHVVLYINDGFTHLEDNEKEKFVRLLIEAQDFVQEGVATLFQVARLGRLTDKRTALNWASNNLPDYYLEKLEKLKFVLDFTPTYRDYFTKKISYLAMETGIRKDLYQLNLLANPDEFKEYLEQDQKNPNKRLEKMIDVLKHKRWILTKPIPEIAELCGVEYFEPTTKKEAASFLNYATGLTDKPADYKAEDIGETPQGAEPFIQAARNMVVANMNFDFARNAEALFKLNDFLLYSDSIQLVFVNPVGDIKHKDTIKYLSGYKPEIYIAGVVRTGEKYLTSLSKEKASEVLNNNLANASMFVKWGGYNVSKDQLIWSDTARSPDLVAYNNPQQMKSVFEKLAKDKPGLKFSHLHMGATEDHPVQSLIVKVEGQNPIHFVNSWGNRAIVEILDLIRQQSRVITNEEIINSKQHINNLFSFWMGMSWDVDWAETMVDGSILIFRK